MPPLNYTEPGHVSTKDSTQARQLTANAHALGETSYTVGGVYDNIRTAGSTMSSLGVELA
jgi:hypothetical protein